MIPRAIVAGLLLPFLSGCPESAPAPVTATSTSECSIGPTGIGPVHLGITVDSARRAFPGARFQRGTDGDGVALVDVILGDSSLISLYAGEDDSEAPIDPSRTIEFVETFSSRCRFPDGVGPGSLVTDVERVHGPVTRVIESEIESRQFVTFERQPTGVVFRLDYTGVFDPGARLTTRIAPGGRIFSVAIARSP